MTYELAKQLRQAGWPVNHQNGSTYVPTLEELIEACGLYTCLVQEAPDKWIAFWNQLPLGPIVGTTAVDIYMCHSANGKTPEIAFSNLWLLLNKK